MTKFNVFCENGYKLNQAPMTHWVALAFAKSFERFNAYVKEA